ncbi:MAG: asparagine synthase (glutamine-hydrolyzing) [Pseudomonadota bacterium]
MCGIVGFVEFKGHDRLQAREKVLSMSEKIIHRGPDAEGVYVDDHMALAHRRLSIIDLTSGQQPMSDETDSLHLVFNGEIYNFLEIRLQLEALGHHFRTNSDTEVILKAYAQWNHSCVQRLNGMFAFALWDKVNRYLFLARDRVGKKPLYYCYRPGSFAFASELKALLPYTGSRTIDPFALDYYYTFGYVPSPLSIFADIRKLEPGSTISVDDRGMDIKTYWSVSFDTVRHRPFHEAVEELDGLLDDAVSMRLMSEVPLGAFLSGGVDSSLIVACMARHSRSSVLTNTIGFDEGAYNEVPIARTVARFIGTDHREFTVNPSATQILHKLSWYFDEPFADSSAVPTWYVCQMAKQNVTVVLSGDGGDESFGGYTFRYIPHHFEAKIKKAFPKKFRERVFGAIAAAYPQSSGLPKPLRLKTIFRNLSIPDKEAFCRDFTWLQPEWKARLYKPSFADKLGGFSSWTAVASRYLSSHGVTPLSRCQQTDLTFYMPEDVLVKVDRMSMAHSLEVRSPLMDYRIIEFAAGLPDSFKIKGFLGKRILREVAQRYLPASIVRKPKQGFSIPAAEWLRGDLKETVEQCLFHDSILIQETLDLSHLKSLWMEHQAGVKDHNVFLWGLMMLGLWEKHYYC